jgi:hypothetical protein
MVRNQIANLTFDHKTQKIGVKHFEENLTSHKVEWILGFVSKRVKMILHVCYDMKSISQASLSELFLSLASLN